MKVGDLIRVQYADQGEWYTGIVVEVPTSDPLTVYQMYCTERRAHHILNPDRDTIEVINEQ